MTIRVQPQLRALLITLVLRRQLNKAAQRRFWRRMRAALRCRSLVLGQALGLCVVLGVGHAPSRRDERFLVRWLLDQPEVREVHIGPRTSMQDIVSPELAVRAPGQDRLEGAELRLAQALIRVVLHRALRHYAAVVEQAREQVEAGAVEQEKEKWPMHDASPDDSPTSTDIPSTSSKDTP